MIEALHVLALVGGTLIATATVVLLAFRILNLGIVEDRPPRKPDAWRIKHGNRYYYMDKTEPFPTQDAEPLYLGKKSR